MNWLDLGLIVLLVLAFFSGAKKGLFVALASLIGLIAGIYCALYFSDFVADYLMRWFEWDSGTTSVVAFGVTFLAVLILVSMIGKIVTHIADLAFLGAINKLLGGLFEVVAMAFIVSVVFMVLNAWAPTEDLITDQRKADSQLYEPIASIAPKVLPFILNEAEEVTDMIEEQVLDNRQ